MDPAIFDTQVSSNYAPFVYGSNHLYEASKRDTPLLERIYHVVIGILEFIPFLNYRVAAADFNWVTKTFTVDEKYLKNHIFASEGSVTFNIYNADEKAFHFMSLLIKNGQMNYLKNHHIIEGFRSKLDIGNVSIKSDDELKGFFNTHLHSNDLGEKLLQNSGIQAFSKKLQEN